MRHSDRPCKRVDIELPLRPCAAIRHAAPAPRRRKGLARQAVGGAVLAAIAGCATHDTGPAQPFRIEPLLRVSNAAASPEASQAYCTLGRYFDGLHEWSRATDAWRQAVAADNRNVEALDGLGIALAQGRRFAEAEAVLRQAVDLAPQRARSHNNLGYVLLLEGRPQEAMAELKVAVSQDGGYAIAQANLREAMLRSGAQPDTAVAAAATQAKAPPSAPQASIAPAPGVAAVSTQTGRVDTAAPAVAIAPTPVPAPAPAPQPAPATAIAPVAVAAATPAETEATTNPAAHAETTAEELPISLPATVATTPDALQRSRLEVSNGNGINGMAARVGSWLAAHGAPTARLTNQQPYVQRQTVIQFRAGHEEAARRLAALLPASAQTATQASPELRSDLRVVLGRDWVPVAQCLARGSCQPTAPGTATTVAAADAQR